MRSQKLAPFCVTANPAPTSVVNCKWSLIAMVQHRRELRLTFISKERFERFFNQYTDAMWSLTF